MATKSGRKFRSGLKSQCYATVKRLRTRPSNTV